MVVCAVPGCGTNSNETSNLTFHPLPGSLEGRSLWAQAIGQLPDSSYVCSRHFEATMFTDDGNTKTLMLNAVPKLFLRSSPKDEQTPNLSECSDEAGSSGELVACRVCLAADGRLYAISGSGLEDSLAALTGVALSAELGFPRHLCAFCRAKLSKCVAFRDSCQRSTELLQTLLQKGPLKIHDIKALNRNSHQLTNNLTQSKVVKVGNDPLLEITVIKTEIPEEPEPEYMEVEYLESDCFIKSEPNDPEDNTVVVAVELEKWEPEIKNKKIKLKTEQPVNKKVKIKKERPKIKTVKIKKEMPKFKTVILKTEQPAKHSGIEQKRNVSAVDKKANAKNMKSYEVPPTNIDMVEFEKKFDVEYQFKNLEEQKQEIEERKRLNTLKYCCDMCGQGYRKESSMINHLWLHDPRLGGYCCSVCLRRFRCSNKLLRHRYWHRDRFRCRLCGLVSRDRTLAKIHHKIHQNTSHKCPYCDAAYVRKSSYYNHIRTAHPERNEACPLCGETFLSEYGLRMHKARAHRPITEIILKCNDCDVTFQTEVALQRHLELSAGVSHAALWPCAACGESCGSDAARAAHAAEKHPPDQRYCKECDKTFSNAASFSLHEDRKHRGIRAHVTPFRRKKEGSRRCRPGTGPRQPGNEQRRARTPATGLRKPGTGPRKPGTGPRRRRSDPPTEYVCEICGRSMKCAYKLKAHRNKHLGLKPFSCPICSKSFSYRTILEGHMLTHTGERPHRCDRCPQAFANRANLLRHIRSVHLRVQATCQTCGKTMSAASLFAHVRDIHRNASQPRPKRDRKNEKKRKRFVDTTVSTV